MNDMKHPERFSYDDTMKMERGALEGRVQIRGSVGKVDYFRIYKNLDRKNRAHDLSPPDINCSSPDFMHAGS